MSPIRTTRSAAGVNGALATFRKAVETTDAYPRFLSELGFDPNTVASAPDFSLVPPTTKKNYVHAYELPQLIPAGDATSTRIYSSSSGSSGPPTHWPRAKLSLDHSVVLHERILRQLGADRLSTLVVVCFAMGNWIGGTYTLRAIEELHDRGFPVSAVAPGVHVDTVRVDVASLGKHYDQVILAGYPPFVRDVLDGAGHDVLSQNIKFLLAGESVGESWRDGILRLVGKVDRPQDMCLVYGTADAGMIGHETSTTIAARRLALQHNELDATLFGGSAASSTLVEYDASLRYIETDERGYLLFTVDNTIPLVRYRINDIGEVITPCELRRRLADLGHDLDVATSTEHSQFVVVKQRADIAVSFYAVNIYPDPVRAALADPQLTDAITGKFVLGRRTGNDLRDTLHLHVELRKGVELPVGPNAECARMVRRSVVDALMSSSSEFNELHGMYGAAVEPKVEFHPYGSEGFQLQIKQSAVERVGSL
ncbi:MULTISPECIES: phenylacetate--CoA ligase family protein [Nocardiaceae]|jgi:phenylacetate-CoA ligase|uniref:phenylacetate--CoA ligase family protein n=1 Tax=Nocardiaceae TaxID=85025 RepID=UPI001E33B3E8|nr:MULTISPECIES: phenylacetate--CoA ligase family protein [Rhodococcus]MCC8929031.1 phenylacetate--CoA ligase family protein [Rhodococcus sp. I2R]MCZ4278144.1 phenylacetate--CoA ligase family protein [Rhodococcus yunnanensis]